MVPLLVHVEDTEDGRTDRFAFLRSPVRIGRGELNDLRLSRPFVSTYHGLVQFDDDVARYVDLGSTNGSILDGEPLERNALTPIVPGSELVIGSFRVTFERGEMPDRPVTARPLTAFAMRSASAAPALDPGADVEPSRVIEAARTDREVDSAAAASAQEAIAAAAIDLDIQFAAYDGAWEYLRTAIDGVLANLDAPARRAAISVLLTRYDGLADDPRFRALAAREGVSTASVEAQSRGSARSGAGPASAPLAADALRLLTVFAESYVPQTQLSTAGDVETLLGRAAAVLETFSRSFLELYRGYEEFGREMGVRTVERDAHLLRARDARKLIEYVLDPAAHGREQELQRAFADFMIHQVALLRGIVDGAVALVHRLDPEEIARTTTGFVGLRAAAMWKELERRYHDLTDEEGAIPQALFGDEFARSYSAIAGRRAGSQGDDDPS